MNGIRNGALYTATMFEGAISYIEMLQLGISEFEWLVDRAIEKGEREEEELAKAKAKSKI